MDIQNLTEKLILDLFEIKSVKFGNFTLKSGINSPIYIDLRLIISYPKIMVTLTDLLVLILKNSGEKKVQHICGVPYTALPLATLISVKTGTSMLIRRKEVKSYGTKKVIEGEFKKGDECFIIEDVVSSGSSIVETVEDLEREGLKANNAIVVLNREQGGVENLEERGIKVHVLTSMSKVLEVLFKNNKITDKTFEEVRQYLSDNKINLVDSKLYSANGAVKSRVTMSFSDRSKLVKNSVAEKLFHTMESKKTLLCLAADLTKVSDLLKLASQVGPHICMLKTHFDALEDFSQESFLELLKIAENLKFLVMEDRKFSDIGNTVCLQYKQIKHWADLVTAHSIGGEGVITAMKSCVQGGTEKGCFLVAELSCSGQLIDKKYTQATVKMAEDHSDFVIGLVCQSGDIIKAPYMIQLTPGVKIEEGSDNMGQNYSDPEYVVLEKGADIAVVGRGIISSSNPEKAALLYKNKLWSAYQRRIM